MLFIDESFCTKWQKDIISIIKKKPCLRTIYWYVHNNSDIDRMSEKLKFIRYLRYQYKAFICSDNIQNIKNRINQDYLLKKNYPQLIIINLPNHIYLSYIELEEIKNGYYLQQPSSLKTDDSLNLDFIPVIFNNPHIIIFSEKYPSMDNLDQNKYKICDIN
jgi:hypothetical protein